MKLRYGTNPSQSARVTSVGERLPFRVLAGHPSYINILDALNAWQLVSIVADLTGRAAATSFKHVSPAGCALAGSVDEVMCETWGVAPDASDSITSAYIRARDADPKSSYGDFVAVSEPVDLELAEFLRGTINHGIIAPGFDEGVLALLKPKKQETMLVLEADVGAILPAQEHREVFGARLEQDTPGHEFHRGLAALASMNDGHRTDALVGMATVRFTQSNAVGFVRAGMMIGIGAGQQSRVDCTRLAGGKADVWWLRRHPIIQSMRFRQHVRRQDRINAVVRLLEADLTAVEQTAIRNVLESEIPSLTDATRQQWLTLLDGVSFVSDGLVTFRDNVDHAARHGVRYFIEPGGSTQTETVKVACREYGIEHIETGVRLFHH